MSISWAKSAQNDLLEIVNYLISQEDQKTAENIAKRIFKATDILVSFPLSGKLGKINGTRELYLRDLPYFIVYKVKEDRQAIIVRIIHTSRLWDNVFN
ncbi:type II toxin-antitoxin system RelE/ParE family toxin [Desulfovibrio litoralis]|uniref:Addiction module toxin, RelE/StbE family n=1 Tax=Desulfovibrio litoralis DSM 11393 TaxID=1121455 RepID=A0A1M7T121_9BACT|nr:type II toxin-antitoxin system RelE/ParE family toxin [Desulfovibrio litoralis]SHN64450.1 addiction module toxin, RelE/StbE family [Desulfovibrio litoralis DSM 11393]